MIPDAVLNQIQDRVDIVEIISGFVPLKRAGKNFKAPCPFHQEKTPSFMVSAEKQIFHCFGCGAGGNVFGFLMKAEKKDFREVVESLAERVGVEIPRDSYAAAAETQRAEALQKANSAALDFYHRYLLTDRAAAKAMEYLKRRGIRGETIQNFKLGYAPESWDGLLRALRESCPERVLERAGLVIAKKDGGFYDRFRQRLMFPILDAKGACVAFGGRVLDDSLPKYLNSPETEIYSKGRHLYGLHQARKSVRECDSVIVVEGYMDLIACHQGGVENVVASLGTALTTEQVRLIKRHTRNVIMLYDADKAGELATLRGLELFLEEGLDVKIVRLEKGHDPDSFIREFGIERFRQALAAARTLFEYKLSLLTDQYDARTTEGKVKIAGQMLDLFSKVQNEVLRSEWLKALARELVVPEQALETELRKNRGRQRIRFEEPAVPPGAEIRPVEKILMALLLENAEFISVAREELRPDDFLHPGIRKLVQRIFEKDGAQLRAVQMMNTYNDDPETGALLSLACAEAETVMDKDRTFSDCLLWMKRSRMRNLREGIHSQIVAAQRQGDRNRISQLLYDLNALNKGMTKINEKK